MAGENTLWRTWRQNGDDRAFSALVGALEAFAFDFAHRVSGRAADAEDLAQEAFLELSQARDDRPMEVGLRAFLGRRIVLNARMLRRAALTRARHEAEAAGRRATETRTRDALAREQADEALGTLDDEARRAVELRFLHDQSYREIGHVLGLTEVNARVRVHRAMEKLRERYGERASATVAALALFSPPRSFTKTTVKTAVAAGGVVLMSTGFKKVAVALVMLAGVGGAVVWQRADSRDTTDRTRTARREVVLRNRKDVSEKPKAEESAPNSNGAPGPEHEDKPEGPNFESAGPGVRGVVRLRDGTPFSRKTLTFSGSGSKPLDTKTDEQGRFVMETYGRFDERDLMWRVDKHTRVALARIAFRKKEKVTRDLELDPGFEFHGRARRTDTNEFLAGLEIQVLRQGDANDGQGMWAITKTAGDGTFRIPLLPAGEYRVIAQRKGLEPFAARFEVGRDAEPADVALRPARRLVIVFRNVPDKARRGIVNLQLHGPDLNPVWTDLRLDADNTVTVDAPPPGRYLLTTIPGESPIPYIEHSFTIAADEPPRVEIDLAGAIVEGTLVHADGTPVANALIAMPRRSAKTTTDEQGRFRFPDVPPGHYGLEAWLDGTRMTIGACRVKGRETVRVDHRFEGHRTVRATPRAPGSCFVTILRANGSTVAYVQARDGREIAVPHLANGRYTLRIDAKGLMPRDHAFEIAGEDVQLGEVACGDAWPQIRLRLRLPEGAVWNTRYVFARHGDESRMARVDVDSKGRGVMTQLPLGHWTVEFVFDKKRRKVDIEVRREMPEVIVDLTR